MSAFFTRSFAWYDVVDDEEAVLSMDAMTEERGGDDSATKVWTEEREACEC